MGDFPITLGQPPTAGAVANTSSCGSVSDYNHITNTAFVTSTAWPAANLAIYYPIYLEIPTLVKQMGWENGTTANGNIDVGIYDAARTLIVNSGTVAQSGTSVQQFADIADTWLNPGTYFLAMQGSATTITVLSSGAGATTRRTTGVAEQAVGSFGLPATATFAAYTRGFCNFLGAFTRATA